MVPQVLVADPDIDSLLLYSRALRLKEMEITRATDGRDALVKALEHPFALVITETRVPFIDGYSLCEVLRSDSATRSTPIMVVTADARPSSLKRALQAGADVALAKPVTDVVFSEAERLILRARELRDSSNRAQADVAAIVEQSQSSLRWEGPRATKSRVHKRYGTNQPPIAPPALRCPSCNRPLTYEFSHIGGVAARHPEQWDDYTCPGSCGRFQYRERTHKLRQL
jgi:CheY-like chemotaxis protein